MPKLSRIAGWLLAALLLAVASGVQAQSAVQQQQQKQGMTQPGNNAPVWREVRKEGQEHYTTVKGRETGVLVQSAGETWRQIRTGPMSFYGGWPVVVLVLVIARHFFCVGA